jgi:hypothetical protein
MKTKTNHRSSVVLELEQLKRSKAVENINLWSRAAEEEAAHDCAARGFLQSGVFGGKIAAIHKERAKRMVEESISLRRETLKQVPEIGTPETFRAFLESLYYTI